jgi:hypothetical protein
VYESQVCLGGGIIESGERLRDDDPQAAGCPPGSLSATDEGGGLRE